MTVLCGEEFTLIVEGPDLQDDAHIEALYEADFEDATIGRVGSVQYVDFDREAETFADAVFSATEGIEAVVPEAQVVSRLGVSRRVRRRP